MNATPFHHDWVKPGALLSQNGAVVLLLLIGLIGCGQSDGLQRASIHGHVTVAGAPLKAGRILFVPIEPEGPAASAAIVDGAYAIPRNQGPILGKHRVKVEFDPGVPPDDEAAFAQWKSRPQPPNPIPPEFHRNSKLIAEVSDKENVFDVAVPGAP